MCSRFCPHPFFWKEGPYVHQSLKQSNSQREFVNEATGSKGLSLLVRFPGLDWWGRVRNGRFLIALKNLTRTKDAGKLDSSSGPPLTRKALYITLGPRSLLWKMGIMPWHGQRFRWLGRSMNGLQGQDQALHMFGWQEASIVFSPAAFSPFSADQFARLGSREA